MVLNGSKLELKSEKDGEAQYVTAKGVQSSITSDNKIEGNVTNIETGSMLNGNVGNKGRRPPRRRKWPTCSNRSVN